jgi:hypothetical protein
MSGYSGFSGFGPQGDSGLSGYSGPSSYSGVSGKSGSSGGSGSSGTSGPSGISGWSGISYKTIVLNGAGGWPSNTIGCTGPNKTETSTNKLCVQTLDFVNGSQTYAEWTGYLPTNYTTSATITATFVWMASGTSTNSVIWGLQAGAYADGVVLDTALGSAVEVTDAHMNVANKVQISSATGAITIAGTNPAAGNLVQFKAYRKGSDNLAVPANLLQIIITYT